MGKLNSSDKIEGMTVCTPMQRGMLYHKLLNEQSTEYVIQNVVELEGEIDLSCMEQSIDLLPEQFQVLKSAFLYRKVTKPLQIFVKARKCEIRIKDLTKDMEASEETFENIAKADLEEGFDLEKDSLLRVTLVRFHEHRLTMLWSTHHVLIDGWCLSILFGAFLKNYEALMNGTDYESLKAMAAKNYDTTYFKYAKWLSSYDMKKGLAYWKEVLKDYEETAGFDIMSRPAHLQRNESVDSVKISVPKSTVDALDRLCKKNSWTMSSLLETAWGIVLQRYTRSNDVVFGKVVSGRNVPLEGIESAVGLFINTIPVRVCAEEGMKIAELVTKAQHQSMKSTSFEHIPLSEIQNESVLKSDLIHTLFVYENYYVDESIYEEGKKLKFHVKNNREETNYGISALACMEEELYLEIIYKTGLYEKNDVCQILEKYKSILTAMSENPENAVSAIGYCTEEEKETVTQKFNETDLDYDKTMTMVDLFEEQVEKYPDKTAVVYQNSALTYRQLDEGANKTAHMLLENGVKKEEFVLAFLERSILAYQGVLGILKAGAVFVPVEITNPEERIRGIVEECNPSVVIVCMKNPENIRRIQVLLAPYPVKVLNLEVTDVWKSYSPEKPDVKLDIHDLAYCIFTSGTTGKPKGVLVEHFGVANLRAYFMNVQQVGSDDHVLQFASFAFDAMISEMTMGIFTGATLYIASDEVRKDTRRFEQFLKEQEITIGILPPQFLQQIKLEGLRTIITAGSETNHDLVMENGKTRVYSNDYGPTEVTVCATYWKHDIGQPVPVRIPIGRPMCNKKIYILNEEHVCGIGMPGEICIGGTGLARGYLNRPELTSEKFIDNPFGQGKLYRSGDLGRWLADGNLEYLGRIDEQVKIRGFRIELQEIENVIRSLEGIKDAAVIAKEDKRGEKNLYAYIVGAVEVPDIKEGMRKKLPDYMIPSYIQNIDFIPVTKNGKLDKRALPDIGHNVVTEYMPPRNEMEKTICEVYQEILGLEQVGIQDDFFEIGGHSLKATMAVNQIEAKTGCRLSLQAFLQARTAEQVAALVNPEEEGAYQPIGKAEEKNAYVATPAQQRIYLAHELDPEETAYNIPAVLKIDARLDREKAEGVFRKLQAQHEALRTWFAPEDGTLMQHIGGTSDVTLEYEEVKTLEQDTLRGKIAEFIRPFQLDKAPLFRVKLMQSVNESVLMIDLHHIIADGMSMGILQKEFTMLYNGETKLEPNQIDYHDYSEWMAKRDIEDQKKYWIDMYRNDVPVLELKEDYPRGRNRNYEGSNVFGELVNKEAVEALAKQHGITEFTVLLGAFMITLSKYSRQDDIVVGSPVSGRVHHDTQNMVGMFVNTLAFRGKPEKSQSVIQFLKELGKTCIAGLERQEYPLEDLADAVCTSRDASRSPLFDVMFTLEEEMTEGLSLGGAKAVPVDMEHCMAKFDVTLNVVKQAKTYQAELVYSKELYKENSIQGMLDCYRELLLEMCQNPKQEIGSLSGMPEGMREQILKEFNDTKKVFPEKETVIEIFEEQAARIPESVAVEYKDTSITYKELNQKTNALGRKLRELGVGKDDLVGIIAERSLEMIEGVFGILKSGGAYVPIDPAYPKERTSYILKDCSAKAVLIHVSDEERKKQAVESAKEAGATVIELLDEVMEEQEENLEKINDGDSLVYCIYTSGTTGKPKGVLNRQKGLRNRILWMDSRYPINEGDCILQKTTYTFDVSVWELVWWSLRGARVAMLENGGEKDPQKICETIQEKNVTVMHFVPSMLEVFEAYLKSASQALSKTGSLKYIFASGEALKMIHVNQFNALMEQSSAKTQLINVYGPTEASIDVTYYDCQKEQDLIPIGKPISNIQMYVLDGIRLCGIGIPGEVCIGGVGLAKGYLNRDELTNEKFIKNPFGEGKLYRTGDLGRWMPDGNLEYLGRIDEQVKIRGFRIELQEVENVIRGVEGVKDAAVIAREDQRGEKNLYAYIVGEVNLLDVKEGMKKKLPDYMVPGYMLIIDEIPVTKNGKLDRRALPEIQSSFTREYVAPGNEMETEIADIFNEVLGREKTGIHDDFFEIGGHSLKATIAVNQIEARTGYRLTLQEFIQTATIEKIAALLSGARKSTYQSIEKAQQQDSYEATPAQKRIYLAHELELEETAYNIPAVLRVGARLDREKVQSVFQKLGNYHEALRTWFVTEDGILRQHIETESDVTVEYEETTVLNEQELKENIETFIRPFQLDQAPLFRVKLLQTENESILMTDIHHIISDGISMEILQKEFTMLYNEAGHLPESQIDYHDYSQWMATRNIEDQKTYWKNIYEHDVPVLELKEDYPRGRNRSYEGSRIYEALEQKDAIVSLAKENGITEFTVMLGTFMIMLSKYSRQEDIVVGSPVSGRVHYDTRDMVGMFVNTLAFRGKPEKKKTVVQFLKELGQSCIDGLENQEYSLEELAEEVCPSRDTSRNPLFDVMFTLEDENQDDLILGGVKALPLHLEHCMAKFDLTLNVSRQTRGYQMELVYSTELYKESSIQRMLSCYKELLMEICHNPEQEIGQLSGMPSDMREQILHVFNDTDKVFAEPETVIEIFEQQAARIPDSIAVEYKDTSITYKELNEKSNALGRKLRELGVRKDDLVGIVAERSLEMIEGIFGILKSGGAYVPIDPAYPKERTAYILKDCSTKAVLIHVTDEERKRQAIESAKEAGTVVIELLDEELERQEENLEKINDADSLVYCIYTSGTTGKPKGVLNVQKGLRNRILWMDSRYPIGEGDCILQKTTYTFDVSVWELVWWSLRGARVAMLENGGEKDPRKICETIQEKNVTVMHFVPSMLEVFEAFLKAEKQYIQKVESLQYIFASGEALKMIHVNNFNGIMEQSSAKTQLINVYGPTEASIDVTYYDCQKQQDLIPIGKPISNIQMYVLDGTHLCGIGMPGEVCIAGTGLAKGYLNREELTSEKFIENPFGEGKLYRTGDLGRWMEDGNLEYLGRIDEQVKIRGFRIELQEVENVIRGVEGVQDAAVIARENSQGEKNLYAYIVGNAELASIKEGMKKKLPDYMVPAYMAVIEEIPVTKNGKLDRRALPEIKEMLRREYQPPETKTEQDIARFFAEILSVSQVGRNDTFMELGGNSIKAASLIMELNKEFHVKIPFSMVFEDMTLKEFSKNIEELLSQQDVAKESQYQFDKEQHFELLPEVSAFTKDYRDQFEEKAVSTAMAPVQIASYYMNIRKTALEMDFYQEVDRERIHTVWRKLMDTEPVLCSGIHIKDEKVISYQLPEKIVIPYFDLSTKSPEEKGNVLYSIFMLNKAYDSEALYDGETVLSVPYLLRLSEKHYKFVLVSSHLILDGFGKDVLIKKFRNLYRNPEKKQTAKPVVYQDYVNLMRKPKEIAVRDFYEQMDIHNFVLAVDQIAQKETELEKFTYTYPIKDWDKTMEEKLMKTGIGLLREVNYVNYQSDEIPMLVVMHGRQYEEKSFSNTIGECLDVLPMVLTGNDDSDKVMTAMEEKMKYLQTHNLNFIGYNFENKSSLFGIEMNYLLEHNLLRNVPVYNYLALYDEEMESEASAMDEFAGEDSMNLNLLCRKKDIIEFTCYVEKGKAEEAGRKIKDCMDMMLK